MKTIDAKYVNYINEFFSQLGSVIHNIYYVSSNIEHHSGKVHKKCVINIGGEHWTFTFTPHLKTKIFIDYTDSTGEYRGHISAFMNDHVGFIVDEISDLIKSKPLPGKDESRPNKDESRQNREESKYRPQSDKNVKEFNNNHKLFINEMELLSKDKRFYESAIQLNKLNVYPDRIDFIVVSQRDIQWPTIVCIVTPSGLFHLNVDLYLYSDGNPLLHKEVHTGNWPKNILNDIEDIIEDIIYHEQTSKPEPSERKHTYTPVNKPVHKSAKQICPPYQKIPTVPTDWRFENKTIDRINKLIALANDQADRPEGQTAALIAESLMDKNNIAHRKPLMMVKSIACDYLNAVTSGASN